MGTFVVHSQQYAHKCAHHHECHWHSAIHEINSSLDSAQHSTACCACGQHSWLEHACTYASLHCGSQQYQTACEAFRHLRTPRLILHRTPMTVPPSRFPPVNKPPTYAKPAAPNAFTNYLVYCTQQLRCKNVHGGL